MENWSQKLIALFVAALMDKFVNQETITLCIDGILCGLLGIISFLGISLIYKNNDDSYRIHWRLILAAFIFLYPWLGWLGTVLVTLIIGATIQNLHKAFQFGVIKSLLNISMTVVRREKITDDEIRPTISKHTCDSKCQGGTNDRKDKKTPNK
mgnify:CR=1 FL=1